MAAITPTGSRTIIASSWLLVVATSPYTLSIASAYQRMARAAPGISSRRLCRIGLPVSRVSSSASSSAWASIKSASLFSTALRLAGEESDQSPRSNTPRAALTARSISTLLPRAIFASGAWVTGSTVSKVSFSAAAVYSPLINKRFSMARLNALSCQ